jgi:nucleoside-diphosphate-sugar epimerase
MHRAQQVNSPRRAQTMTQKEGRQMPEIKDSKYVVVGGASLLGSHLGEQLLAAGAREVLLLDSLALGTTDNIDHLLKDPRCNRFWGHRFRCRRPRQAPLLCAGRPYFANY